MTLRPLPQPVSTTETLLAAVVDRLDQLTVEVRELSGRLDVTTQPPPGQNHDDEEGAAVRLLEPDPGPRPVEPARLTEPAVPEPPRYGKGSSRQAWADYARHLGLDVSISDRQSDIVAAVDAARQAA